MLSSNLCVQQPRENKGSLGCWWHTASRDACHAAPRLQAFPGKCCSQHSPSRTRLQPEPLLAPWEQHPPAQLLCTLQPCEATALLAPLHRAVLCLLCSCLSPASRSPSSEAARSRFLPSLPVNQNTDVRSNFRHPALRALAQLSRRPAAGSHDKSTMGVG